MSLTLVIGLFIEMIVQPQLLLSTNLGTFLLGGM